MFKKLALLAAAAVLYTAAPTAPAAAQGINVQIGGGGGYHRDRGYHGGGYRHSRNEFRGRGYHRGWDRRGPRGRTIIVR